MSYSRIFKTIYDQKEPVGSIGRGCHYSILRMHVPTRYDQQLTRDFAVIWDEDHDDRVITALEYLYQLGLLSGIVFAGERKGSLTLRFSGEPPEGIPSDIDATCHEGFDSWSVHTDDRVGLVSPQDDRAEAWMAGIVAAHGLGRATVNPTTRAGCDK